jgi:gluconate 2-dehydrogenase gamma chain
MKQDRRRFLKTLGALSAASSARAAFARAQSPPLAPPFASAASASAESSPEAYVYLTRPEVEFLDAAIARLIPADELGPGAKEAGVAVFIDRQLAGDFGTMAHEYRLGPWAGGTPQQGYQSRLTPQQVYRAAIAETDRYCEGRYGKRFAELTPPEQENILRALDEGTVRL